jgi:hypothetical protein
LLNFLQANFYLRKKEYQARGNMWQHLAATGLSLGCVIIVALATIPVLTTHALNVGSKLISV